MMSQVSFHCKATSSPHAICSSLRWLLLGWPLAAASLEEVTVLASLQ